MSRIGFIYFFLISLLFLNGCQSIPQSDKSLNLSDEKNDLAVLTKKSLQESPVNFLVLGVDFRDEDQARADGIMVVQYSAENKSIKIVSIMRDSYVKIPGYEHDFNKINHSYFLGGEELLKETIEDNFNLTIDHTVTIDFQGFVKVVDTIVPDGIKVEVKQELIDDMNLNMAPGENILHGEELLKYVRFRHDAYSDFGRVERQQEVLLQLADEMKQKMNSLADFAKVPRLADEVFSHVKTDLALNELLTLLSSVFSQPIEKIETMKIPVEDGFSNKTYPHAGEVLELNFLKNIEVLDTFFDKPTPVNK